MKDRAGKVSISRYLRETKAFMKKHCKYMDELAAINVAESKAVALFYLKQFS